MSWSKFATLALLLVVIFTVSVFCSHFGYTVNGVPAAPENNTSFILTAFSYYIDMVTFQVDDVPELFNYGFILLSILAIAVLISIFIPGYGG